MQIIGQYGEDGELYSYNEPISVSKFGATLREIDTGIIIAVAIGNKHWFSSALLSIGVKRKLEVEK